MTPHKMPVVYVSGPYRSRSVNGIAENIFRARTAAVRLWKAGAAALCPHLNTAFMDGACPDETWLAGDIEMLRRCDAMLVLDGWADSAGTCAEISAASTAGIPTFGMEEFDQLVAWIVERRMEPVREKAQAAGGGR